MIASPKNSRLGYKQRPKQIIIIALIIGLAPWINFVLGAKHAYAEHWHNPAFLLRLLWALPWWLKAMLSVNTAAAVLLLWVRRPTFFFVLSALLSVFVVNLATTHSISVPVLVVFGFMLSSYFARPFLQPQSRWWETARRYPVAWLVTEKNSARTFRVLNVSKTGILFEMQGHPTGSIPQLNDLLKFEGPEDFAFMVKVVRVEGHSFGACFVDLKRKDRKQLLKKAQTLTA